MRRLAAVGLFALGVAVGAVFMAAGRAVRVEAAGAQTTPLLAIKTVRGASVGASNYAAVTDGKGCWLVVTNGANVAAVAQAPMTTCQ